MVVVAHRHWAFLVGGTRDILCGVDNLGIRIVIVGGPEFVDAGLCGMVVIMRDGERESNTAVVEVDPGAEAINIGERERGIST